CLWSSQNPDTVVEKIVQRLTPGTYYIVVDGYRGATGNYRLNLNYLSSCSLDLGLITVAGCNNTSSLTVQVAGGRPDYLVNIFGPVTRVGTSKTGTYQFTNLPSGQYFVE